MENWKWKKEEKEFGKEEKKLMIKVLEEFMISKVVKKEWKMI